jgi:hypothetical protein
VFNIYGFIFIVIIMIPNIVFAIKCKDGFENKWQNKYVEFIEQTGRVGCFTFMIINIPGTCFGFRSNEAFLCYVIINVILVVIYCLIWIVCFNKTGIFKALLLSIIPSIVFIFSGIMNRSVLLTVSALLFFPSHTLISYKNEKMKLKRTLIE